MEGRCYIDASGGSTAVTSIGHGVREVVEAMTLAALERGLIVYPGAGSADGVEGDHTLLAPPLILTRDQADEITEILDQSLAAVARSL